MKRLPARWTPHTAIVEAFAGEGGAGPIYGAPETFSPSTGNGVYCEDSVELIRDETGAEVVSKGKVYMSFEDAPAAGSKVTTWPGLPFQRTSVAITTARFEHPAWPGYGVVYLQ